VGETRGSVCLREVQEGKFDGTVQITNRGCAAIFIGTINCHRRLK
jgi:hypothetical protein